MCRLVIPVVQNLHPLQYLLSSLSLDPSNTTYLSHDAYPLLVGGRVAVDINSGWLNKNRYLFLALNLVLLDDNSRER